jgi:hypothetical protein
MNEESIELTQEDLVDRIADALPDNLRADFYREMRHCRSLQENDEMLRILRIMQFLTLLTESVPRQVVVEREKLESLFAMSLRALKKMIDSSETYHEQLDLKLTQLPNTIKAGIKTETIVASINESLRQEFSRSTIPETAKTLGVLAEQMKKATSDYAVAARSLSGSYQDAAEKASQTIHNMNKTITQAAKAAKDATEELSYRFEEKYYLILCCVAAFMFVMGLLFGKHVFPVLMR